MKSAAVIIGTLALLAASLNAQSTARRPYVRASGQGVVSSRPDQVRLAVAVQTQAPTAAEAADQNATRIAAVIAAVRQILGPNAEIRTLSYSLNPNYRAPQGGGIPTLTGFTASNTVEVTSQDLGVAGRLIDAAVQAGATNVQSLRFGLSNPEPARREALRLATIQARAGVDAIAAGLNARLGAVVSAEESSAVAFREALDGRITAGGAATPIETGTVDVSASVVLEVEISGQ